MKNILSESTQFHLQCKYFNKFYSLFDYFGGLLACILSLSFILVRTHSELSSPQPDPLCCTRCPLATEKRNILMLGKIKGELKMFTVTPLIIQCPVGLSWKSFVWIWQKKNRIVSLIYGDLGGWTDVNLTNTKSTA